MNEVVEVGRLDRRPDLKLKFDRTLSESNLQSKGLILNGISSSSGLRELALDSNKEKKSSFQITRVVSRSGGLDDSDSIDDRTGFDDPGDRSYSTNVLTNIDSEDTVYSSLEDVAVQLSPVQDELKEKDVHSRFRLVKIDAQDGIRRGRWHCLDFGDNVLNGRSIEKSRSVSDLENYVEINRANNDNQPQTAVCDIPSSNLLQFSSNSPVEAVAGHGSLVPGSAILNDALIVNGISHQSSLVSPASMVSPSADWLFSKMDYITENEFCEVLPAFSSSLLGNGDFASKLQFVRENLLAGRIRKPSESNEVDLSESGASAVAIDNKIEQAMDLVKSHLMFAVREEVEQLKLKIQELSDRNAQLEYENMVLRESAPQETLAKLQKAPSILPS